MSKEIATVKTYTYAVYTREGCEVTDTATGMPLITAEPGKPNCFPAMGDSVTVSDDAAIVFKPVFNSALAALGLLGEGDNWPAEYTRLAFIKNAGGQYIDTGWKATPNTGCRLEVQAETSEAFSIPCGDGEGFVPLQTYKKNVGYSTTSVQYPLKDGTCVTTGVLADSSGKGYINEGRITAELNFFGSGGWKYKDAENNIDRPVVGLKRTENPLYLTARNYKNMQPGDTYFYFWSAPFYSAVFTEGRKLTHDYRPALNSAGRPCLLDVVTGEALYNSGQGEYIVGVATVAALAQILKRLPATGGNLSLSLPADANTPEVLDMLQTAAAEKGWQLPYTFRPAAVATFALRRVRQMVWCKLTPCEYGGYVAPQGVRANVEHCAGIVGRLGTDPTAYGYAAFDSVDAAAEHWQLVPYEAPEEENLNLE